jgi:hypothetical protein
VGVRVTNADGSVDTDEAPIPVSFEVRPSILITELQPTTADCGKPALRLIGGMRYKVKTRAIGFKPTSIEYTFQTPSVIPDRVGQPAFDSGTDGQPRYQTRSLTHTMGATPDATDAIDEGEAIILPPVPTNVPTYGVVIAMTATDAEGRRISNAFGMTAHNAIELFNDNRFELAQIYPAVPVSACIPGGQQGRRVDYSESATETKQRTISLTMSKSFLQSEENNWSTSDGKTVTRSTTVTDGYSKTIGSSNSFSFSQSGSTSTSVGFNWADTTTDTFGASVELNTNVSIIPKVWEVGGKAGANYSHANSSTEGGSVSVTGTSGWSQGSTSTTSESETVDRSTATTDSTAVTTTDTKGGSTGEQTGTGEALGDQWSVSSSQTIQRGFSASVVANTYGVFYRQMARYTRRAFVVVYDKCGDGEVVGDLTMQDYVWAPDLALGEQCPPFPKSNFPEPQCYLPPCDP